MSILKLIPDFSDSVAADYYNKMSYDTFTDTEELFTHSIPNSFTDYVDMYKAVVYQSACTNVPSLNDGSIRIITRHLQRQ